ncbi:MAG: tRNA (N6-threonylcarbamoyladenosine(37)-N6)-methyltransferase TrmO [Clostridia bacterium]|nr:tRNA (N6-threonylcarbamoyladenosine(37)-N6)-methyltransferase TrmO [Clostridia bacterium]
MRLKQIGIVHSPYKEKGDAPPQGRFKEDRFIIEIYPEFAAGLKDIEGVSHLIVLYWCDRADRNTLVTKTPWDEIPHGVFATRSPNRPNPIAFDIVDLISRQGNKLLVSGMDALDKSPVLDIKPYNSKTDAIADAKIEWLEKATM